MLYQGFFHREWPCARIAAACLWSESRPPMGGSNEKSLSDQYDKRPRSDFKVQHWKTNIRTASVRTRLDSVPRVSKVSAYESFGGTSGGSGKPIARQWFRITPCCIRIK